MLNDGTSNDGHHGGGLVDMDMEEVYSLLKWPMNPDDERARRRFIGIKSFFNWAIKEGMLPEKREVRVLDMCAGTGIAGAALADVLREWGYKVTLTVLDKRKDDLELVEKWIEYEDGGEDVEVLGVVKDCREPLTFLRKQDIVLIWGLTMPHFDPFEAASIMRNVASILSPDGSFIVEEIDRVYGLFYQRRYKDIVVETKTDEYTLISIDEGYDLKRGVIRRSYYRLPGFERVFEMESRLWDLAGLAGMASLLFDDVRVIPRGEHEVNGVADIILMRTPRR